jgi:GntR family transcriptional repressor for pyruvate dehydrogenase complex
MTTNDLFQPIERKGVSWQIVEQFHQLLADRHLVPGSQLPPERELAELLQVGRTTTREAIRALECLGLVATRPGQGTFVRVAEVPLTILARPALSCADYRMVLEARRAVEPALAALAATRATPAAILRLEAALTAQATEIEAGRTGTASDVAFHTGLSRTAGNRLLDRVYESLEEVLRLGREPLDRAAGQHRRSLAEHRAVLDAVQAHDAALAERQMAAHLDAVQEWAAALPCWCGSCAPAAN